MGILLPALYALFLLQVFLWFVNRNSIRQPLHGAQVFRASAFGMILLVPSVFLFKAWDFRPSSWPDLPASFKAWSLFVFAAGAWQWLSHGVWFLFTRRPVPVRILSRRVEDLSGRWPPPLSFLRCLGVENQMYAPEVLEVELPLPGWPEGLRGLSLVHLSDLHFGGYVQEGYLVEVRRIAEGLSADLWCLTGDFISFHRDAERGTKWLSGVKPPLGAYAVLGNHDHWTDPSRVRRGLEERGVRVLVNDAVVLERGGARLELLGADDHWHRRAGDEERLRHLAAEASAAPCGRILLAHNPDHFPLARALRCHLQLSGHCHGGQVRLPLVGPLVVPSDRGRRFAEGFVKERGSETVLFIHRGVGAYPPVRTFCRPQVVKLTLVPTESRAFPEGGGFSRS